MKIFFFTGTGNSLYAARQIGSETGKKSELLSIPRLKGKNDELYSASVIGFVFPCYSGGTPKPVVDFIKNNRFEADYIFAVMTYGKYCGAGVQHFTAIASENGIPIAYSAELLMVDNYLPLFEMSKQLKNEPSKKVPEQLKKLCSDISAQQKGCVKHGFFSRLVTAMVYRSYLKKHGTFAGDFDVDDNCTVCALCTKICPSANIILSKKPVFGPECEQCFACIHNCPVTAIHHRKEKSGKRYRHAGVTVQDIIEANHQ